MTTVARAREEARQPNGEFGSWRLAEADGVDLSAPLDQDDRMGEQDEPVQQETSYSFPAWKVPAAVASIDKANRRAERAGIDERFGYRVETWDRPYTDDDGIDRVEEMATLHLDRPVVRHEGWEFSGTLTWDPEVGLVTRVVPGAELTERPADRTCDVCGQNRDRRDTYVVQRTNPDTGEREQLQVGSNCLQRFMGIRPAGLWILEFDPDTSEGVDSPPPSARVEERFDSRQMLALGLAVVEQHGWVSRSAANAYNAAGGTKLATADLVAEVLRNRPIGEDQRREFDKIRARAAELRDGGDAGTLLAEARQIDGDSEYAENLRAVASAESVTHRNAGLLLSAIGARTARQEREAKKAAQKPSNWIGQPKAKITDLPVTVEAIRHLQGDYGVTTLVSMRDEHGNVVKWFASGHHDYPVGTTFTMKATVKGHGEYDGVKETTVTRAKLAPVGGAAAPAVPAHVPTADPANAFANLHTRADLLKEWDRREAAWQKKGRNDPDVQAEKRRLGAEWDAREAEVHAATGGNASPPPAR